MNEKLSEALAQLAGQLGVTTTQLWDWMQGYGIRAYASVMVAQLSANLMLSLALAAAIVVSIHAYFKRLLPVIGRTCDEDACMLITFALGVVWVIAAFFVIMQVLMCLPELVGWVVSPEGMVIEMLVDRV
jgi:hypothetical protein